MKHNLCKKSEAEGSNMLAGLQRYISSFGRTSNMSEALNKFVLLQIIISSKCDFSAFTQDSGVWI